MNSLKKKIKKIKNLEINILTFYDADEIFEHCQYPEFAKAYIFCYSILQFRFNKV